MATTEIVLNGSSIKLHPQPRPVFMSLASVLIQHMYDAPNIGAIVSGLIADGLEKQIDQDNPRFQALLWLMHEMGVREFRVDGEQKRMEIDRQLTPEERARDTSDPYTLGNIATGRAVLASVANLRNRTFTLNGESIEVRLQERATMEEYVQKVLSARGVNEDHHSAAMRGLVSLVADGVPSDDVRVKCAILLLSDLGVRGMRIAKEGDRITVSIDALNEFDAMAAAFLQGGQPEHVHQVRDRVVAMRAALIKRAQASAGAQPAPSQMVTAAIKRRRR